ncbi:MAG: aldehyde ferredoxin oxidoreductase C-terminal domain-containing protein, partial [Chloroflexota bacterium]|nr:aldehyde ferredoxin oxidoreductase C-terminal domain-containing protein [Chloroflexota bacterium]
MECYEKGVLSKEQLGGLDMSWGNVEAVRKLMGMVAHRQGIGDILAEGVMRAAQEIGGEATKFAIHTAKGNTPRGHDHRARWSEMFDTSVSNTGTLETSGIMRPESLKLLGLTPASDGFSWEEVSTHEAKTKGVMMFEDSLGVCRFNSRTDMMLLPEAVAASCGWEDFTPKEAVESGLRVVNILRAFNIRHGISPELDRPSFRYGSVPLDGPAAGTGVMPVWDKMLANYYSLMGWDTKGVPTRKTLKALGIEGLADDLGV